MNFAVEQIKQAKQAKSADELLAMANAQGVKMSNDEAEFIFDQLNKEGELTDDELFAVAGGKGEPDPLYEEGQQVYVPWFYAGSYKSCRGTVISRWFQGSWKYSIEFTFLGDYVTKTFDEGEIYY